MTVNMRTVGVAVVAALLFASLFFFAVGGAAAQQTRVGQASMSSHRTGRLSFAGTISPAAGTGRTTRARHSLPFLAHGGSNKTSPGAASAVPVVSLTVPGPSAGSGASASATQVTTSFDSQSVLGSDQAVEPPDPIVATDGTYLVELVNDSGMIWKIQNGTLIDPYGPFDLNSFFYVPSGYSLSDPRILYDPSSGRWIASGVAFTSGGGSAVDLNVSATANPESAWTQYFADSSSDLLHDQPKLGVSGEQIVLSWNDFLAGSFFEGATTWVLDKAGVENGTFLGSEIFGPDSSEFSIVPASVMTGNTEYGVWNDADCGYSGCSTGSPTLGVVAISGTPVNSSVSWTTYNPPIAATSNPPSATQPSPGNALATDDDRLITATWSNGDLWTSGNDACTPPGDNAVRSCARLIEVSLTSGSPVVTQDFDAGALGAYVFYPAVAVDGSGDLAVVYSASSASLAAGVGTAGQAAGNAPDTLFSGPWLESGAGAYVDGTSGPRWGDYSGAAAAPVASGSGWTWGPDIWVDGEYTAAAKTVDWGTAAAQLTFGSSGGSGSPNSITVSANPATLTVGSGKTSQISASVTNSSGPVSGDTVNFATSGTCGSLSATSATTSATGIASVTYKVANTAGTCTIKATELNTGSNASTTITQQKRHK